MSPATYDEKFEGRSVGSIKVIVRKTGDGLSDAMEVEPEEVSIGQVRYVLMKVVAKKVRFQEPDGRTKRASNEDDDLDDEIDEVEKALVRVQDFDAISAIFVDDEVAGSALEEMEARILAHKEAQKTGQQSLADSAEGDE